MSLAAAGTAFYLRGNEATQGLAPESKKAEMAVVRKQATQVLSVDSSSFNSSDETPKQSSKKDSKPHPSPHCLENLSLCPDYNLILQNITMEMLYQELDAALASIGDPEMVDDIRIIFDPAYNDLEEFLMRRDDFQAICDLIGSENIAQMNGFYKTKSFGPLPLLDALKRAVLYKGMDSSGEDCL